ncbi:MBL fold metallo-hydrolase [Sulfitobacter sp. W027]|uniref:MBL fold metallo-hydrolase n=1 Tax=Sulfitobacter sp. W027 TaxID=2867025 RepID=UPI0021A77038|nr:MBL fold metallo-hydrolase [Sulfitobacter sp. W027]UWR34904.1 MBL fold metallo-hydrolase [Sulfitobacter sp. W027]
MQINRRMVLAGMGGAALAHGPLRAFATTSAQIGDYEFVSVSDGNLVLPRSFFFDGLPQEDLAQALAPFDLPLDQLEPPCNLTLLRDAERVVLFDAGSGPAFMPSAGVLLDSLEAVGVAPEAVTDVIFTHGHPDHLWGVLDDFDDLVFPNASYHMGQVEWDYWRDPATVDTIGAARAAFAAGAARRLEAIEDRVSHFSDGEEVLPGITAQASFGHTPGHMSFVVGGSEALMIGGDAIGNHHLAFARPGWASGSDQDPELGAQTRERLLDRLSHEQMLLMGFHLPNGGLGRVERDGDSYRFLGTEQ